MAVDLLAIAAHPDDIELTCAGTLAMWKRRGGRFGVVDLVKGHHETDRLADLAVVVQALEQRLRGLPVMCGLEPDRRERSQQRGLVDRRGVEQLGGVTEDVERAQLAPVDDDAETGSSTHGRLGQDPVRERRPWAPRCEIRLDVGHLVEERVDTRPLGELELQLVDALGDLVARRRGDDVVTLAQHQAGVVASGDHLNGDMAQVLVEVLEAVAGVHDRGEALERPCRLVEPGMGLERELLGSRPRS